MSVIDIIRYGVILNAFALLVQSIRVIATYQAVYALSPKDWKRQLPLHVWLITLSFALYIAGTTYFLAATPNVNTDVRLVVYGVAGLIAQYALYNILQYDRRRYSKVTNFQDPDGGTQ